MTKYGAIIDGKRGAYGVVIPDLPGCFGAGKTIDGAITNAVRAAGPWAEVARKDGCAIPKPRSIDELRNDPDVRAELDLGGTLVELPVLELQTDEAWDRAPPVGREVW